MTERAEDVHGHASTGSISAHRGTARTYFRAYLRRSPLAQSIFRAIEAEAVGSVELPRPMLDIGCGFGEFGDVFFDHPGDVGLDVSHSDLRLARRRGTYEHLTCADGRRLPFAGATFASVLSMSVLEHIDQAERVVPEAWRVLRPGGVFVFTTPAPSMGRQLFYSRLLAALRLRMLADGYGRMVDGIFHHVSLRPLDAWKTSLEDAGFLIREARETIPPTTTAVFDLALPGALPSQLGRLLGRGRWVWRPPGVVALMDRLLGRFVEARGPVGCNYFIVADKP